MTRNAPPAMGLVTATAFRKHYCEAPRPALATVIRWVDSGDLPGCRIGRHVYVDVVALRARIGVPSTGDQEQDRRASERAEAIARG